MSCCACTYTHLQLMQRTVSMIANSANSGIQTKLCKTVSKTSEMVMQVKPKLAMLKRSLLGTGSALAVCALILTGLIRSGADANGMYGACLYFSSNQRSLCTLVAFLLILRVLKRPRGCIVVNTKTILLSLSIQRICSDITYQACGVWE